MNDRLSESIARLEAGRTPRILVDGCDSCRYSKVYCHAMLSMVDGDPCCPDCSHS